MIRISQIKLDVSSDVNVLYKKIKKILGTNEPFSFEIVRRSIDSRYKPTLYYVYSVDVSIENEDRFLSKKNADITRVSNVPYQFPYQISDISNEKRPVIIGMGPAGMFAGLYLARAGFKPIILERGKDVDHRSIDVRTFWNGDKLNVNSNVLFGEGGAGTFSDGKLNTLVKDTYGRNKAVLKDFVKFGADESIIYDSKPHIGTDVLCSIVKSIRNEIIHLGGEVFFENCVTDFVIKNNRIAQLEINKERLLNVSSIIVAVGHSARDTFIRLKEKNVNMTPKPFAVGFRVMHPQSIINLNAYGVENHPSLSAATYKLTYKAKSQRGVYTFCMCPGGFVVNASSEEGKLCINGMSYSQRDSEYANSAVIVTVSPDDFENSDDPLCGMYFQRSIEEKAYKIGNGNIPYCTYEEFKNKEIDSDVKYDIETKGQSVHAETFDILPEYLNRDFVEGMEDFGRKIKGFNDPGTFVLGVEARTSSPVRMERDDNLTCGIEGMFVCGEGAGYAGGITSAAMDGIKCAEAVAKWIMQN